MIPVVVVVVVASPSTDHPPKRLLPMDVTASSVHQDLQTHQEAAREVLGRLVSEVRAMSQDLLWSAHGELPHQLDQLRAHGQQRMDHLSVSNTLDWVAFHAEMRARLKVHCPQDLKDRAVSAVQAFLSLLVGGGRGEEEERRQELVDKAREHLEGIYQVRRRRSDRGHE